MALLSHMTSTAFARSPGARVLLLAGMMFVLVTLSGCQMLPWPPTGKTEPPPAPPPEIEKPHVPTAQEREIQRLLAEASTAMAEDRLTTPSEDCAYYRYVRVLKLDPENGDARIGLSDIVERYLNWALMEARSRRFGRAYGYLASARSVDETHPNIAAVARQIDELQQAHSTRYKLSREGLAARSAEVAERLREIGAEIARSNASVVITARSDPDGRWIYQQLNAATGTRVRAQMQIGTPPSVELLAPADSQGQP